MGYILTLWVDRVDGIDFPQNHPINLQLPGLWKSAEGAPLCLAVPNFGQHRIACHACSGALIGYGQPAWFPLGLWESLGNMRGLFCLRWIDGRMDR